MPDLRISVTLTFDHPVTAFSLVVGGWYSLSLATGRVVLIDRNVLGIISQLGKRTHRHDSVANNWWLEYLDSEHCVLNPVLCAMEGAGRKRPSETEFRDSFTLACAAIRQRLPRARLQACRRAQDAKRDFPVALSPCARRQPFVAPARPASPPDCTARSPRLRQWLDGATRCALRTRLRDSGVKSPPSLRRYARATPTGGSSPRASPFRGSSIEFGDESVRAALQTIEDSHARYLAESRFLIEACPYISDRRPNAELRRTEEAVLQSARQCELDLFSLPVLAVLSCL